MSYLRGTFALLSPAALLQALCQEQRSAYMVAQQGVTRAAVWITEGLIVGARCEELDGPEAVYRLVSWNEGRFLVTTARDDAPGTMAATCEELLLEAARRRDEAW